VFSIALQAGAQGKSGGNRAAAEALFNQGRDLMTAGKFTEACPKFEASQQLDPGLGTMLNLAECYEKTGRSSGGGQSAWHSGRSGATPARRDVSRDAAISRQLP
jgi:hypothetical protein